MRILLHKKIIQISGSVDDEAIIKTLDYAQKSFTKCYHLRNSLLILDDKRYKKDYLLARFLHASGAQILDCRSEKIIPTNLSTLLESTYMPLRIKVDILQSLVESIKISIKILTQSLMILSLERENKFIETYIKSFFSAQYVKTFDKRHIYLRSQGAQFWENLINFVSFKMIENVSVEFNYADIGAHCDRKHYSIHGEIFGDEKIQESYDILGLEMSEDFAQIKKRYLSLVKEFHPDNVYGKNSQIIEQYTNKFHEIQSAYEYLKNIKKQAV